MRSASIAGCVVRETFLCLTEECGNNTHVSEGELFVTCGDLFAEARVITEEVCGRYCGQYVAIGYVISITIAEIWVRGRCEIWPRVERGFAISLQTSKKGVQLMWDFGAHLGEFDY